VDVSNNIFPIFRLLVSEKNILLKVMAENNQVVSRKSQNLYKYVSLIKCRALNMAI